METLNSTNFEENTKAGKSVIMFSALSFCGPCRVATPLYEKFATESTTDTKYFKVACEDSPDLVKKFGIKGVPAFLVLEEGEVKKLTGNVKDFSTI